MNRLLTIAALLASSLPYAATYADQPRIGLRGTLRTSNGVLPFVYVFNPQHQVVTEIAMPEGQEPRIAQGGYASFGDTINITWESGSTEVAQLTTTAGKGYTYRITAHSGDPGQVGTVTRLSPQRLPANLASQLAGTAHMYRTLLKQRQKSYQRQLHQLRDLRHDIDMLPYEYSNAFGRALGQITID